MKQKHTYLLVMALLCCLGILAGCAKKYDYREEKRAEEQELRRELSQALLQGKGVVLTKYPRRSIWVSADKSHSFSFHQELPDIGGYTGIAVEPGTYYFAGGRVQVESPSQNALQVNDLAPKITDLGKAHVGQVIQDQRTAEYRYATLPVYYGSSFGYGSGWGRRHGYWGGSPFYGVGMHTDSSRTVRSKVAVHSQTSVWSNTYVVALPNDGRVSNAINAKPLVASITVQPGEAVLLDEIYITKIVADAPEAMFSAERRVLLASASASSGAAPQGQLGPFPITAMEIKVVSHAAGSLPVVGGISAHVEENKRVTRGVWLGKAKTTAETHVFVKKTVRK